MAKKAYSGKTLTTYRLVVPVALAIVLLVFGIVDNNSANFSLSTYVFAYVLGLVLTMFLESYLVKKKLIDQSIRLAEYVVTLGFVVKGFLLATQSGLQGEAGFIQNDGYAASGGVLILVGGVLLGLWLSKRSK